MNKERPVVSEKLADDFKATVEAIRFDSFIPGNYYKHKKSGKVFRFLGGAREDHGKLERRAICQDLETKELWLKKIGAFMSTFDPTPVDVEY